MPGPLKETVRGNKYYLVIDCHFSKFIQLYALKNIQTESLADKLVDDWCCTFGIPEQILEDGGKTVSIQTYGPNLRIPRHQSI